MLLDPSRPAPIWLVLPYLSFLERLFFLGLMVLGLYVILSAITTVLGVRKMGALLHTGNSTDAEQRLIALRRRSVRVDKLITTAFYLFGVVLFLGLQDAYFVIDNSKIPVGSIILRNIEPHFAFAGNVFFVLLFLHVLGWFISCSVGRLALQCGTTPRTLEKY